MSDSDVVGRCERVTKLEEVFLCIFLLRAFH